ncbi:MAG: NADH-quinone oxidoreductase subunit C [Bdellovibrionales bacterium]|nr:NADH-quinone oxidoreductase subunit C [Bdellovibrionales bacterium]
MRVEKERQKSILAEIYGKYEKSGEEHGDFWIQLQADNFLEVVNKLRSFDDASFDSFVDLCGVDFSPAHPRFESVVHLYSRKWGHRIRLRVMVPDESITVPSITHLWKGANWQERESYDMYGIRYEGHPDLRRILSPPKIDVHPQRKDYPLKGDRDLGGDLQ